MIKGDFKWGLLHGAQKKECVKVFDEFLKEQEFEYVLEIGTYKGGFASFLHDCSRKYKFEFETYDIKKQFPDEPYIEFNFHEEDIFNDIERVSVKTYKKKSLILCDGGDKIKEMDHFFLTIDIGSVIMCHDYSPNRNFFKTYMKNRIWDHCEITASDVIGLWDGRLKAIKFWDFINVAWGCFQKI